MENLNMEKAGETLINLLKRSVVALQEADAVIDDYLDVSGRRDVIEDLEGYLHHLATKKLNEH